MSKIMMTTNETTKSARTEKLTAEEMQAILDWMWEVLGDPDVVAAVPAQAREEWHQMITTRRTPDAAADAAYAAADAAYAVVYAADAADDADAVRAAARAAEAARAAARAVAYADAAAYAYAAAEAVRAASVAGEVRAVWTRHNPARVLTALTSR